MPSFWTKWSTHEMAWILWISLSSPLPSVVTTALQKLPQTHWTSSLSVFLPNSITMAVTNSRSVRVPWQASLARPLIPVRSDGDLTTSKSLNLSRPASINAPDLRRNQLDRRGLDGGDIEDSSCEMVR
ncbi:hypothetical protein H257_01677 [Aphanomyces astaci]|uniref:Secreted protein n=1 Tax=Aphanomyces astaci TaxID=112090 RepID=W4H3L7_APHAT|nr:hypothetical protein H257_01677 [Aphanomyces astaci]ETV86497.1 hypothetical protein H257_01677 [Aphanomyces astaci]|eukprot:XP_009823296.1 hypothetical protein H257_01677 [Aphanomyces astaci]